MMKHTKENPLRVMTLCSGYDSQCLALERLKRHYPPFDYELVAWAEFDPESKRPLERQPAVVAHNAVFPQWADRNLGDMTKIAWTQVADFDLLFYSTPCQSISAAGLQHGFAEGSGTRSSIIWNVRDAVKTKHPKYLCLENVKAMVSKKFLPMFNLWQYELERLGCLCCPLMSKPKRIADFKKHPAMVRFYIRAGQKYLQNRPDCKIAKLFNNNVYDWFASNVFCDGERDFRERFGASQLFGNDAIDTKAYLEQQFNIKL